MAFSVEDVPHGGQMRNAALEGFGDGLLQGRGAVGVEQAHEPAGHTAEVAAALGDLAEELFRAGCGVMETVHAPGLARLTLGLDEGLDMGGILDLRVAVEAAGVGGDQFASVEDAHRLETREDEEGAAHMSVRDRVVVQVEAHVGCLADMDGDALVRGEGIVGQSQHGRLLGVADFPDGVRSVLGALALGGGSPTPLSCLPVEVGQIREGARRKESIPYEAYGALATSLLVSPSHGHGARREAIVSGKFEKERVEADRFIDTLEDGTFQIVIQHVPRNRTKGAERVDVPAQEVGRRGAKVETQEDLTRVGEDHHEAHEEAQGTADEDLAEVSPIDLSLISWERPQTQVGFRGRARAVAGDDGAEVIGTARVAPLADHVVEPAGSKPRVL